MEKKIGKWKICSFPWERKENPFLFLNENSCSFQIFWSVITIIRIPIWPYPRSLQQPPKFEKMDYSTWIKSAIKASKSGLIFDLTLSKGRKCPLPLQKRNQLIIFQRFLHLREGNELLIIELWKWIIFLFSQRTEIVFHSSEHEVKFSLLEKAYFFQGNECGLLFFSETHLAPQKDKKSNLGPKSESDRKSDILCDIDSEYPYFDASFDMFSFKIPKLDERSPPPPHWRKFFTKMPDLTKRIRSLNLVIALCYRSSTQLR